MHPRIARLFELVERMYSMLTRVNIRYGTYVCLVFRDMKMRLVEFVKKDSLWEWRGFVGRSVEGETEEYGLEGY